MTAFSLGEALLGDLGTPTKGFWYVASPYSAERASSRMTIQSNRYWRAIDALAILHKAGYSVFSPIVHWHMVSVTRINVMAADKSCDWNDFNRPFLEACCGVIVVCLEGWRESVGVTWEFEEMRRMGKPIKYMWNENRLPVAEPPPL